MGVLFAAIFFSSCEEKIALRDHGILPEMNYDLSTKDVTANGVIRTITSDGTTYLAEAFTSQEPTSNTFITSYVIKEVTLDDQVVPSSKFKLDQKSGVLSIASETYLAPGNYVVDIKVSSAKNSNIIKGAFKLKAVDTGVIYNKKTAFLGKNFTSGAPEIKGDLKEITFTIEGEKHGFVINDKTGEVTLDAVNSTKVGSYTLNIKVTHADGEIVFPSGIAFAIEKEIIAPSAFSYDQIIVEKGQGKSILPVITGNNLQYSIKGNSIEGVSLNQTTGEVTVEDSNNLNVGEYSFVVEASNSLGSVEATVQVKVVLPKPKSLVYAINEVTVIEGKAFNSVTPSIVNGDNITYALEDTRFAIDKNGVISLADGNNIPEGDYQLKVLVTYPDGVVEFENVFTIHIVAGAVAPTTFNYPQTTAVQGCAKDIVPVVDGAGVTFRAKENLPAGIVLDENTGVVKIEANNTLAIQDYNIVIIAGNSGGELETTLSLTIETPPSNFQYETNQITTGTGSFSSSQPTITDGIGVKFSIDRDDIFEINETTGVISRKDGVDVVGGEYDIVVTANKDGFKLTTNFKVIVWQVVYTPKELTGASTDDFEAAVPSMAFGPDGGTHEVRGFYFTGMVEGVQYTDVLIKGGAANFTPEVKAICDAAGLTRSGKLDTNKFRDWIGVPPSSSGAIGKGPWDGTVKVKSGKFISGKYSLVTRYGKDGKKAEMHHVIDININ